MKKIENYLIDFTNNLPVNIKLISMVRLSDLNKAEQIDSYIFHFKTSQA